MNPVCKHVYVNVHVIGSIIIIIVITVRRFSIEMIKGERERERVTVETDTIYIHTYKYYNGGDRIEVIDHICSGNIVGEML